MPPAVAAVAVAVSGGRDSTALLHATARVARTLGLEVHALHVHHGLVAAADGWVRHLRTQCRRWARGGLPVHLHVRHLEDAPAPGDSIEAWARRRRYRALAAMAHEAGCDLVLLAHHRRDQAETLLLQALRGGGPAGLAAMPAQARRAGIAWARPWLEQPREAVEAYVHRHRLRFVDDASNADPRFARNRLRHEVWPALVRAFPDAETQLQAAARRAAEAAACLAEQVAADCAATVVDGALRLDAWSALAPARRRQLLRAWLGGPESLVQRLADDLPGARSGRWPVPGGELRLHDGCLRRAAAATRPRQCGATDTGGPIDLSAPGVHRLPGWGGALVVTPVATAGVAPQRLRRVLLRARRGGEQFQLAPRSVPRCLKKQFQARRVPAWDREGPLLFDGDSLLFVPSLGLDARCMAERGEVQLGLQWVPDGGG